MNDRRLPARTKSIALTALACAIVGSSAPALAQDPVTPASPAAPGAGGTSNVTPAATLGAKGNAQAASTPPGPLSPTASVEEAAPSWFARAPLTVAVGQGTQRWSLTFLGFVEADYIYDTTRSYHDAIGSSLVARSDTYAGTVGRSQFSVRNTRLGMMFEAPAIGGVKPSAVLEGDFFGNQPEHASEAAFYDSPTFRLRHAYLKLQSDVVDLIAGQTYDVFGWQNYFSPCTAQYLGLPNQVFSRSAQLRLAHSFNSAGAVSVDVAIAGVRPAQRDSAVPDVNAGLRVSFNNWKGITTPGNVGTVALPLSIGVSGTARQFKVNAFTPKPTQNSNSATGWGVSVDALIPIIPAADGNDRGNRLTLTGGFVTGTGIADLITAGGGATFPTLPNPQQQNPAPLYDANIDNGLVSFDLKGVAHTIDWQAFRAGIQYYLPPTGRVIVSVNYTRAHSKNLAALFPKGGAEVELLGRVADTSQYGDVTLFWDATPAVRLGLSGQYTQVTYLDGDKPHNVRGMGQALYAF